MRRKIEKAMVLAAGYGTRLKPLTDRVPKPLVPVAGKPMIEYALDKLREYGVREVIVNVSHLKDQLTAYCAGYRHLRITLSEESEPLETGGGLRHALPLLGDGPVLTINSDIIWVDDEEPALDRLTRFWDGARMDVLLLAQSKAGAVGHERGEDPLFVRRDNTVDWNDSDAPYIVAGVGILHPRILRGVPGGKFSVKVLWRRALAENRLACVPHRGRWFQTGTVEDIRKAEAALGRMRPIPSSMRQ
jgi:N-acetyl-alpha-D-muramate 1-phosphate uridylyltransferase